MNSHAVLSASRRHAALCTLVCLIQCLTGLNRLQSGALAEHLIRERLVLLSGAEYRFGNPKYRSRVLLQREWRLINQEKNQ
jgi:hypothetical protein